MNSDLTPLTPPDCNLREYQFMPLEVKRLLTSETWILGTGEERAAAITLWLESWHQIPAASLPSDDRMLAHLSQSKQWKKVKDHALRGWVKCSDGRLYHATVAEKALEGWIGKLLSSLSGSAGNAKRWGIEVDMEAVKAQIIDAVKRLQAIAPQSEILKKTQLRNIVAGSPPDSPPDKKRIAPRSEKTSPPDSPPDRNREGEGEGERKESSGVGASHGVGPVDNSESPPPLSADAIGETLVRLESERGKDLRLSSRAHEALLRIAAQQIAMPVLLRAHALACARRASDGDPLPVNPGLLEAFIAEAQAEGRPGAPPGIAAEWDATFDGVQAMADRHSVRQGADEPWLWFRLRVIKASGDQRLIEREVGKAERMNPGEFERVSGLMYGNAPAGVVA